MIDWLTDTFASAQAGLFEQVLQPLMFGIGLGNLLAEGYNATGWLLLGLLQIALMLLLIAPLQRWRPVEPLSDPGAVRVDILYTLIHRLGLFRLALFFTIDPLLDGVFGALRARGVGTLHLDQFWPGVTDLAWVSFILYLLLFDFVDYWLHRAQHHFNWWWALHALHHSQRQLTMWSDNRNHLLSDLLRDLALVLVAQALGVGPSQFMLLVAVTQLSESLQHANLKLWFGPLGERLWVSPRFHRLHHAIGIGHQSPGQVLGGCNFGVLLPCWDLLFGSANFELRWDATGVRDQVEQGRDYGRGFWAQQWLGLLRLVGRA